MGERLKDIKIVGQDHKGRGIAKTENGLIFVEKTLEGEVCDIEIKKTKKKFQEATPLRFQVKKQIEVTCPYYDKCGGCDILHQKYEDQLKFKTKKIKEILHKFAGLDISLQPILYGNNKHYRNKITLHNLGLYQKESHRTIPIESCELVMEEINEIIKTLSFLSKNSNNIIETAMIRVSNQKEIMLELTGKILKSKITKLFPNVDVLIINGVYITKKKTIHDQIEGLTFEISNTSFYQVNHDLTEKLYQTVIEDYKDKNIQQALDLYCGTGTIALLLSRYVKEVTGIEVVASSIQNALHNQEQNKIENVTFLEGKVEDLIDSVKDADAIIVDPPREGLDKKTIESILTLKPTYITYVSCDAITLARDLNLLKEDYNLLKITPVDMFPNTYHVECVCLLQRK